MGFVRAARGDPAVAAELEEFITLQCSAARRADRVEALLRDLDRKLGGLFHAMEEVSADFEALQQLEKGGGAFARPELDELRSLFGLYGMDTAQRLPPNQARVEYVAARQRFWADVRLRDSSAVRHAVAERAESRYAQILDAMTRAG